ncbi:MAG: hypothetical protein ACXABO_13685 [Promethearchaeota archaeon]
MKNKKSLLGLFLTLLILVGILFTVNVKAAQGTRTIYPNGTHSQSNWEKIGGSTYHGCVADQSESKYIVARIYYNADIKFNMGSAALGSKHAYTLKFRMMASTNEGAEITIMRMKVDGEWHHKYAGVDTGWEWYSLEIDGWWDNDDIDAMLTGIETQYGDWNNVRVSRVKVIVYWTDAPI